MGSVVRAVPQGEIHSQENPRSLPQGWTTLAIPQGITGEHFRVVEAEWEILLAWVIVAVGTNPVMLHLQTLKAQSPKDQ